jgi:hypothetical protein
MGGRVISGQILVNGGTDTGEGDDSKWGREWGVNRLEGESG